MAERFGGRVLNSLPRDWPAIKAEIDAAKEIVFNISRIQPGSFTEMEFRYIMSRPDLMQKTVWVTDATF